MPIEFVGVLLDIDTDAPNRRHHDQSVRARMRYVEIETIRIRKMGAVIGVEQKTHGPRTAMSSRRAIPHAARGAR